MKKALCLSALIASALMLPVQSKADSFSWSTNGGTTETTLSSFSMVQGKNEFEIQVPSSSWLAMDLFIDSLLKREFPQIVIDEFANVNGHGQLDGTAEFDGASIIGFEFGRGRLDTFHFSFKSDPGNLPGSMPEPSSLLLLSGGIAGLGLLKRRFA
jgi:PEP-CTERM motif